MSTACATCSSVFLSSSLNQSVCVFSLGYFQINTIVLNSKTRSFPLLKAKYNNTQEQIQSAANHTSWRRA